MTTEQMKQQKEVFFKKKKNLYQDIKIRRFCEIKVIAYLRHNGPLKDSRYMDKKR
jgi:hypothetical protein